MKPIIPLSAMLISLILSGCASRLPLATVSSVDLQRYSGRWYEIAKYPNWFQKGCAGDTMADYTIQTDGTVQVINRCLRTDGRSREVRGVAKVVPNTGNARLKVRFGWSPVAGDYWIIGLDDKNYSWALVGHPSRKFLWILAREPQLPAVTYQEIIALAEKKGFQPERIVLSPQ